MGIMDSFQVSSKLELELGVDESILLEVPASKMQKLGINFGGKIFITNKRFVFQANKINITEKQRGTREVFQLEDVVSYCMSDNVGIGAGMINLPGINKNKNISIQTKDAVYVYTVGNKIETILETLNDNCPNAEQTERQGYVSSLKGNLQGHKLKSENKEEKQGEDKVKCSACGCLNKATTKFCEECGNQLKMQCPSCGTYYIKGKKFCNECGTSLQPKCSKCGSYIKEGTKFCNECGTKIADA